VEDGPVQVAERGPLAVSDDVWNLAVRRAVVIGPLARAGVVGWRLRTRRRPSWAYPGGRCT
jgi:hypothetical protein